DRLSGACVDGPCLVVISGYVQSPVDDERRVLQTPSWNTGYVRLKHPLRHQPPDILRRNLFKRPGPRSCVIAGKRKPARRVFQTFQQVALVNRAISALQRERQHRNRNEEAGHVDVLYNTTVRAVYDHPRYGRFRPSETASLQLGPDREFVSVRIGEMKPASAGKGENFFDDFASGISDLLL